MSSPRVLFVAFHYPPVLGGSGVHRTLAFTRYLPELGWQADVLTVQPWAYPSVDPAGAQDIPAQVSVVRAPALDSARHLSLFGRSLSITQLPDRWQSWIPAGVIAGMRYIRRFRPAAIISTYPVASAHAIGYFLHRFSKLPWYADFRDPMAQDDYPERPEQWRSFRRIEERAVTHAAALIFTTPGAIKLYGDRYPQAAARMRLIPNGFDERDFAALAAEPAVMEPGPVTLLHSGVLYAKERNPLPFFHALADLKKAGKISSRDVRIVLRACGHVAEYSAVVERLGLGDLVQFPPTIDYKCALVEMAAADGLLLFQGRDCNYQIPAKAYEYIRIGKPVLALTDHAGDTARLIGDAAPSLIADMYAEDLIAGAVLDFIARLQNGSFKDFAHDPAKFSRRARCEDLAHLLQEGLQ